MDLGEPLRAVVPTLDGPVLRVLAGTTKPLTGRAVARLTGTGSEAGVRRVLDRLVAHGLVGVSVAGPAHLYVANRAHLAWPAVTALVSISQRFRDGLTGLLSTWDPEPALAGLFGSAARGDGTTDSDIDVLLVRPDAVSDPLEEPDDPGARVWAEQVDRFRLEVETSTGNRVQVYELSRQEFAEAVHLGDPLVDSWRQDLVVLAGPVTWMRASWLTERPATRDDAAPAAGTRR